jgi:hypothetical protein
MLTNKLRKRERQVSFCLVRESHNCERITRGEGTKVKVKVKNVTIDPDGEIGANFRIH